MNSTTTIAREELAVPLAPWEQKNFEAGERIALPVHGSTLLLCEQGVAMIVAGKREHPVEQATLAVIPADGEAVFIAQSACTVRLARLAKPTAGGASEEVYACHLGTLAAASALADHPIEITGVAGFVLAVQPAQKPLGAAWMHWLALKQLPTPQVDAPAGFALIAREVGADEIQPDSSIVDVAVIGAGPAGLSAAAHASTAGLRVAVYGQPMAFWKRSIVPLPLRSKPAGTIIDTPREGFKYMDFAKQKGLGELSYIPFHAFLAYTQHFIEGHRLRFIRSQVLDLRLEPSGLWRVTSQTGTQLAKNVVVAVGLKGMERIPQSLRNWPGRYLVASEIQGLESFRGKRVAIVGSGQSALELALEIANVPDTEVTLLVRSEQIKYRSIHSPNDPIYKFLFKNVEKVFRYLPILVQDRLIQFLMKGTAEPIVESRLAATQIRVLTKVEIQSLSESGAATKILLSDGRHIVVDHLVLGTGYRYDIRSVPFLRHLVESRGIRASAGLPVLSNASEASARGLFFAGMSALRMIGPQCQFVFGTRKVTPRIMAALRERLG